jgi:DNA replication protein DnaC
MELNNANGAMGNFDTADRIEPNMESNDDSIEMSNGTLDLDSLDDMQFTTTFQLGESQLASITDQIETMRSNHPSLNSTTPQHYTKTVSDTFQYSILDSTNLLVPTIENYYEQLRHANPHEAQPSPNQQNHEGANDNENNQSSPNDTIAYVCTADPPSQEDINKLNPKQRQFFELWRPPRQPNEVRRTLLEGGPGTGKTFTARLVARHYIHTYQDPDAVLIAAPTGAAANLHEGAGTIHSSFLINPPNKLRSIAKLDAKASNMYERLKKVKLIIIDEISMVSPSLFEAIHARLSEVKGTPYNNYFADIDIILLGDFHQLRPVQAKSLMSEVLEPGPHTSFAAKLFRSFRRFELSTSMRAGDDRRLAAFLADFSTVINNNNKPLQMKYITPNCKYCRSDTMASNATRNHEEYGPLCSANCSHGCQHFRYLSADDIQDPSGDWDNTIIVTSTNQAVDAYNMFKLIAMSKWRKEKCYRYRLPQPNGDPLLAVSDELAERFPRLYGYFMIGAPVNLTYNLNTSIGLSNGTRGVLHSIVFDPREQDMDRARHGTIHTLQYAPIAVNIIIQPGLDSTTIQIPSLARIANDGVPEDAKILPIVTLPTSVKYRTCLVSLGKLNKKTVKVTVSDPGYELQYAATFHAVQGLTLPRIIIDLNPSPSAPTLLSLEAIYVAISRVKFWETIRLMPLLDGGILHNIAKKKHSTDLISYKKAFNREGWFDTVLAHGVRESKLYVIANREAIRSSNPLDASFNIDDAPEGLYEDTVEIPFPVRRSTRIVPTTETSQQPSTPRTKINSTHPTPRSKYLRSQHSDNIDEEALSTLTSSTKKRKRQPQLQMMQEEGPANAGAPSPFLPNLQPSYTHHQDHQPSAMETHDDPSTTEADCSDIVSMEHDEDGIWITRKEVVGLNDVGPSCGYYLKKYWIPGAP